MNTGFLFPGQGSQRAGMLHDLIQHPVVDETLAEISEVLGFNVLSLDSADALRSTVSVQLALFAAETLHKAGLPIAEITMTVPGAVDVIAQITEKHPDFIAGAGTVLDAETAKHCLYAGARFLSSPA